MALARCKECGKEISEKAVACPGCGAPTPKPTSAGTWFVLILVMIGVWQLATTELPSPSAAAKPAATVPAKPCRSGEPCWIDQHRAMAQAFCEDAVERSAKWQYEWTDGVLKPRFTGSGQKAGRVIVQGDKIKMQNGFGAWQNQIYTCTYDPSTKTLVDLEFADGRL